MCWISFEALSSLAKPLRQYLIKTAETYKKFLQTFEEKRT